MSGYVKSALFIYSREGQRFEELISSNPHSTVVQSAHIDTLRGNPAELLQGISHVVVAAELTVIKEIMGWAMEYGFSMGFLPLPAQKALSRCYSIPKEPTQMLSLALKDDPGDLDIVFCNDTILLFKDSIGRIPLIDSLDSSSKTQIAWEGLKTITSLRLLPFTIKTSGATKATYSTAACGCMVFENPEHTFALGLTTDNASFADGMISTVLVAPFSIVDYLKLIPDRHHTGSNLHLSCTRILCCRSRQEGVGVVLLFLIAISIPLIMAYQGIVERAQFEKSWEQDRFLVNKKYLIVKDARIHKISDTNVLTVELHARELLNRRDLNEFRRKVEQNFAEGTLVRVKIIYIP